MNESKHTPLPWRILDNHPKRSCLYIQAEQSELMIDQVATLYGPDSTDGMTEANAALIVRAVNSHADLVAALEAIVAEIDGPDRPYSTDSYLPTQFVDQARAALAKAKWE